MQKQYTVKLSYKYSSTVYVDAESKEEAIEKAVQSEDNAPHLDGLDYAIATIQGDCEV
jgi:hypothetical protein